MNNALMERSADDAKIVLSADDIQLIKTTVAVGATDAELKLFLFDCARQGVHPLDRLIHFTKRSGKYTPITSIDFMRIRAADSGEMAGSDDPVFTGDAAHDMGSAWTPSSAFTATSTVYRITQGQRFAYTATARWSEYKPEQNDFMWRKMPHTMLGKCAEALALRKGFPRQLAGLYAREEMEQAESTPDRTGGHTPTMAARDANLQRGSSDVIQGENPATAPASRDDGPDLGVDLPEGALRIVGVGPGKGSAIAEVTLSNGESLLVWRQNLKRTAEECMDARRPVQVEIKHSAAGNPRIESITPLPTGDKAF